MSWSRSGPTGWSRSLGTQSQGQGHETVFAQILAESLGVPAERIEIRQGDTRSIPHGGGTGGSSSTIISGTTLRRAADVVIQRGRDLAAERLETAADDIAYRDGAFEIVGTDRRIGLFELAAKKPFSGDAVFADKIESFPTGVMVCEVEVDPETGLVRIDRLTRGRRLRHGRQSAAAGRPDAWRHRAWAGQRADGRGRVRRGDRPAPERHIHGLCPAARRRRADLRVETIVTPSPNNFLGLKGVGELPTNGAPAAIANAVARRAAARWACAISTCRSRRKRSGRRFTLREWIDAKTRQTREAMMDRGRRRANVGRMLRILLVSASLLVLAVVGAFAGVIAFNAPAAPPVLAAGNSIPGIAQWNFAELPQRQSVQARDGAPLNYRRYPGRADGTPERVVVLVHGSTGSGIEMHKLAQALQAAGATVYAISLRGHGGSGTNNGDVSYRGQLDDDLADLVKALGLDRPGVHRTLAGFSSGGGFVLRIAGGPQAGLFDDYLAISPYVASDSPTNKPNAGGWAGVALPRIVALSLLDGFGLPWFQGLPPSTLPPRPRPTRTARPSTLFGC